MTPPRKETRSEITLREYLEDRIDAVDRAHADRLTALEKSVGFQAHIALVVSLIGLLISIIGFVAKIAGQKPS